MARSATRQTVVEKLAGRLSEIAKSSDRIKNKAALSERSTLTKWLSSLDEADFQEMETGYGPELRRQLYIFDESLRSS